MFDYTCKSHNAHIYFIERVLIAMLKKLDSGMKTSLLRVNLLIKRTQKFMINTTEKKRFGGDEVKQRKIKTTRVTSVDICNNT